MKSIVLVRNGIAKKPYSRIFIRRKQKPIDYASVEPTVSMAAENQVP